ncbi:hypothetical protein [Myxosarcina sp. GI1(2024)]
MSLIHVNRIEKDNVVAYVSNEGEANFSAATVRGILDCNPNQAKRMFDATCLTNEDRKQVEMPTESGLKLVYVLPAKYLPECLTKAPKSLQSKAVMAVAKMAVDGANLYLRDLAGYKTTSELPGTASEKNCYFDDSEQQVQNKLSQKCYNETQAKQAYTVYDVKRAEYGFNKQSTTEVEAANATIGNLRAVIRLNEEKDKSLVQNKACNIMAKQARHTVVAKNGVNSIPFDSYPKKEQKLIEKGLHPVTGNPSSKCPVLIEGK